MKTSIVITVILCITSLELYAMYLGIDGVLFTTVIAVLAGLAGLIIPTPKILKQNGS